MSQRGEGNEDCTSPPAQGRNIMNGRTTGMLTGMTIAFVLTWPTVAVFSQAPETDSVKDRIEIQEKLLYAYAYAYDSKDCESYANLFAIDAVLEVSNKASGRDAIRQGCLSRQKNVVGKIKTSHNMMNIVFGQLTARRAKTKTKYILMWETPDDQIKHD